MNDKWLALLIGFIFGVATGWHWSQLSQELLVIPQDAPAQLEDLVPARLEVHMIDDGSPDG